MAIPGLPGARSSTRKSVYFQPNRTPLRSARFFSEVPELKEELRKRNLPVSGRKAELLHRLEAISQAEGFGGGSGGGGWLGLGVGGFRGWWV